MDRKKWNYDLIWTFACYLLFTGKICQPTFAEFTLFQCCSFESESSPWGWHVLDLPCLTANLTNIMLYTLTKKKRFIVIHCDCPFVMSMTLLLKLLPYSVTWPADLQVWLPWQAAQSCDPIFMKVMSSHSIPRGEGVVQPWGPCALDCCSTKLNKLKTLLLSV